MIRTRFAPSPTGYLHIGSLRTALFNYLFARKNNGVFVLRIEDTDRERYVPSAETKLMEILRKFKLEPDEGPHKPLKKYAPYVQSERLDIYKKNALQLLDNGHAYYCFCSPERLGQIRKEQELKNLPPRYDGRCRSLRTEKIERNLKNKTPFVVRHKVPVTGVTEFNDLVYGHLKFRNELLDDSVLIKSDGYPVYNFANVVDDHLMDISHVIRGEEFLSSTPKHVLLYSAFGWNPPTFCHLPLILDSQKRKLSKRSGDVAVEEYLKKGYLKEAILNFIALLGWNPKNDREIFSLDELVAQFSFEKVNKSGAIFDTVKLDYLDREWRKKLDVNSDSDPLFSRYLMLLEKKYGSLDKDIARFIWPQILERISGPSDLEEKLPEFDFYFRFPEYHADLLIWKKLEKSRIKQNLQDSRVFFEQLHKDDYKKELLEKKVKDFLQGRGLTMGETLWPLRVALSGKKNSPGPFEIMEVLFKQKNDNSEILTRLEAAIKKLD